MDLSQEIPLTKDLKIKLLRWLKSGSINRNDLQSIERENEATLWELLNEMDRISDEINCDSCRRAGNCYLKESEARRAEIDAEMEAYREKARKDHEEEMRKRMERAKR